MKMMINITVSVKGSLLLLKKAYFKTSTFRALAKIVAPLSNLDTETWQNMIQLEKYQVDEWILL